MRRATRAIVRLLLTLAILGGLAAGAWWWTTVRPERVAMATVSETPLASGFTVTGRVRSTERARVGAKVAGRVIERRVDRGARVERGDVIAVLAAAAEEADVAEARAEVAEAEARLAELRAGPRPEEIQIAEERLRQAQADAWLADNTNARARRLIDQGFIAAQQAEEAKTRAELAAHEVARAKQALEMLRQGTRPETLRAAEMTLRSRQARLRRMEATHADLTIVSPLTGTVVERYVEPGETVTVGQTLVLIESTDPVRYEIRADVEEALIGRVQVGQRALLAPEGAARALEGRVTEIAPGVESARGTVEVKIRPARVADARAFRPGMTVDVTVVIAELARALVVPRAAVWSDGDGRWVTRVRGGQTERVRVRAGIEADGRVQVLEGLSAGDLVVIASPDRLAPGRAVLPLDGRR